MACRKFRGGPLTKQTLKSLSLKKQEEIWSSIACFLKSLHSFNFNHPDLVEYPLGDNNFWNDLWKPIEKKLEKDVREKAYKYFNDYFLNEFNNPIKKTICHADFHPNHIFYDSKLKKISGIIDFGRICINDPAIDFNLIQRFYGQKAVNTCLKYYSHDNTDNFKKRILFQNRRRLFAAFFHAKAVGQTQSFPRYLKRIEKVFLN